MKEISYTNTRQEFSGVEVYLAKRLYHVWSTLGCENILVGVWETSKGMRLPVHQCNQRRCRYHGSGNPWRKPHVFRRQLAPLPNDMSIAGRKSQALRPMTDRCRQLPIDTANGGKMTPAARRHSQLPSNTANDQARQPVVKRRSYHPGSVNSGRARRPVTEQREHWVRPPCLWSGLGLRRCSTTIIMPCALWDLRKGIAIHKQRLETGLNASLCDDSSNRCMNKHRPFVPRHPVVLPSNHPHNSTALHTEARTIHRLGRNNGRDRDDVPLRALSNGNQRFTLMHAHQHVPRFLAWFSGNITKVLRGVLCSKLFSLMQYWYNIHVTLSSGSSFVSTVIH